MEEEERREISDSAQLRSDIDLDGSSSFLAMNDESNKRAKVVSS
jgi:hypothetical protein